VNAPEWPYIAARVIDLVIYEDVRGRKLEVHRARAYNPGDLVSPTAVIGDPKAGPDAWLEVGPDVSRREDYPPKPEGAEDVKEKDRPGNPRLGRPKARSLSE
jgi:hypothetical protein